MNKMSWKEAKNRMCLIQSQNQRDKGKMIMYLRPTWGTSSTPVSPMHGDNLINQVVGI